MDKTTPALDKQGGDVGSSRTSSGLYQLPQEDPLKPPRILVAVLGMLALVASTGALAASSDDHKSQARVVGYYIEWGIYGRNYTVKNVATSGSASRLSVINYAFANVEPIEPNASGNVVCKLADAWAD